MYKSIEDSESMLIIIDIIIYNFDRYKFMLIQKRKLLIAK